MTHSADPPHQTPERARLSRLLIGTILILIFYVASVPWVFHLIHVHFGHPARGGLEYFVTIYCYPARRTLKLSPTIRSYYIPYWQWAFRIVIRYLR